MSKSKECRPKPDISLVALKYLARYLRCYQLKIHWPLEISAEAKKVAKAWGISMTLYMVYCVVSRLALDSPEFDKRWLHNLSGLIRAKYPHARRRRGVKLAAKAVPQAPVDVTDLL